MSGPLIPDLVALTADDPGGWTWDTCILCESTNITHRGLFIRPKATSDQWEVHRVAWCPAEDCQHDRELGAAETIYPKLPESEAS